MRVGSEASKTTRTAGRSFAGCTGNLHLGFLNSAAIEAQIAQDHVGDLKGEGEAFLSDTVSPTSVRVFSRTRMILLARDSTVGLS